MMKRGVDEGEPNLAGFNEAFGVDRPFFDWLGEKEQAGRNENFALAMGGLSKSGGMLDAEVLVQQFDWAVLGDGTVVDVRAPLHPPFYWGSGHPAGSLNTDMWVRLEAVKATFPSS